MALTTLACFSRVSVFYPLLLTPTPFPLSSSFSSLPLPVPSAQVDAESPHVIEKKSKEGKKQQQITICIMMCPIYAIVSLSVVPFIAISSILSTHLFYLELFSPQNTIHPRKMSQIILNEPAPRIHCPHSLCLSYSVPYLFECVCVSPYLSASVLCVCVPFCLIHVQAISLIHKR